MPLVPCERPLGGGRAKIENSSRRHPRKFGQKRFLVVRRSWRGNGVACFWATSLEEIIGGVTAIVSYRPGGWISAVCRTKACYPVGRSTGASCGETARVRHAPRRECHRFGVLSGCVGARPASPHRIAHAGVSARRILVCRQSISDSWLGNLRECLAHLV